MKKRKICVITGTRAEYGLLYWLIKGLHEDKNIQLQLCVTGTHLSPEFGLTYREIEKDGFFINKKVEMILSSDSPEGVTKSIGIGIIGFAEAFTELKPDMIVVLGDRFEILAAAIAAMVARIPIVHCHGGESSEGAIDEPIRHSLTKMSHLHFVSTEIYRKRVIQMGEQPGRVFNVGALGIESINRLKLLSRKDFEKSIGFKLNKKNLLITFHPVTLENASAQEQFTHLLKALDALKETHFIFTYPNADTEGRVIIRLIDEFVAKNKSRAIAFASLGQLRYLSALKNTDAVIGNSSSGLIEAPAFHIGTINIGDRQRGRIRAGSVIDCKPGKNAISKAIQQVYSPAFQKKLETVKNPYGEKNSSESIIKIIKNYPLKEILKKKFYDIEP